MANIGTVRTGRYTELDSLRGLAALAVFFSHSVNMLTLSGAAFDRINNSVLHIFWDGAAAVVLFFVLSGFVLMLPFAGQSEREPEYVPFIIKRVFRIYPAYLFALFFSILIKAFVYYRPGVSGLSPFITQFWGWNMASLTEGSVIRHILMIGPRFEMGQIVPIIWSLIVEMKVSVLFPFIILVVKDLRTVRSGAVLFISTVLLYKLSDKAMLAKLPFITEDIVHYVPMFLLGALLARFKNQIAAAVRKLPALLNIVIIAASIVLYTGRFSLYFLKLSYANYNYVISIGVAVLIVYVTALPEWFGILRRKPVKLLGDISFSLYLLHFPILMTVASIAYGRYGSLPAAYAISLLLTLVLSYLSYRLIEQPFQKLGRSIAGKFSRKIPSDSAKSGTAEPGRLENRGVGI